MLTRTSVILLNVYLTSLKAVYAPNVGSVLFSSPDVSKKYSNSYISLLRARAYFQSILPKPGHMNPLNDDYLDSLLEYIRETYSTVGKEALDPQSSKIMTAALSDVVGGYLKAWILPVTKLAFYSGTISQDHTIEVFKLYDEIKRYLNTDGTGWRKPNLKLLKQIPIKISPKHMSRSTKIPCECLAYFKETPQGLSVPVPTINWDKNVKTIFVPLKNESLISVNSPNASESLGRFYDAAKKCLAETSPAAAEKFDDQFQLWLRTDVLPHLKDDNLFLALGGVLSLVNRTRNLCDTVMNLYSTHGRCDQDNIDLYDTDIYGAQTYPNNGFSSSQLFIFYDSLLSLSMTQIITIVIICGLLYKLWCDNPNMLKDFKMKVKDYLADNKSKSEVNSNRSSRLRSLEFQAQTPSRRTKDNETQATSFSKKASKYTVTRIISKHNGEISNTTIVNTNKNSPSRNLEPLTNTDSKTKLNSSDSSIEGCYCEACCLKNYGNNKNVLNLQGSQQGLRFPLPGSAKNSNNKNIEVGEMYTSTRRIKMEGFKISTGKPILEIGLSKPSSKYCFDAELQTRYYRTDKNPSEIAMLHWSQSSSRSADSVNPSNCTHVNYSVDDIVINNRISKKNNRLNFTL